MLLLTGLETFELVPDAQELIEKMERLLAEGLEGRNFSPGQLVKSPAKAQVRYHHNHNKTGKPVDSGHFCEWHYPYILPGSLRAKRTPAGVETKTKTKS